MFRKHRLHFILSIGCWVSFLLGAQLAHAAQVKGKVTDENDNPLSYATLYVEGTTLGTTTNIEGDYALNLNPGNYNLVFQYVGYLKQKRSITVGQANVQLNIQLQPETLQLREVIVNAQSKDPAYAIVQQTIDHKKQFREEINAYQCQVYMKGLQRLDERPDRILGVEVPIDTGIVYLSESVSELTFHRPDKVKERMISSKVSGNQSSFSFNQASQTLYSIYDDLLKVEGITERGYVSPLAKNALFFYDYKLEGVITEGNYLINKIRVYPKRKTDPTFEGHLYILEDLWRVTSFDLTLTKDHQLEFLDELTVTQVHAPVADSTWVMLSQNFEFYLNTFGFKGSGYFSATYSDYLIELNPEYYDLTSSNTETIDTSGVKAPNPQLSYTSIDKKDIKNEILKIEEGSNERSDAYWDKMRPIPLTTIEKKDYYIKDSIAVIKNAKAYKDSTDQIQNKISIGNILYSGYQYQNSYQEYTLSIPSIIQTLQYNTVEGLLFNLGIQYTQSHDDNKVNRVTTHLRYGIASHRFYGQMEYRHYLNHRNFETVTISGGQFVKQFNPDDPISPFINTLETLLDRRNYMKLYERTYLALGYQREITNGIMLKPALSYSHRHQLHNETDYSFFYRDSRDFTSNTPDHIKVVDTSFEDHSALQLQLGAAIRFGQKYISLPDKKIIVENKYPKLNITYTKGIATLGADIDYDKLELEVEDDISMGLFGTSTFRLGAGAFLNRKNMEFMDYQHFNTNASVLARYDEGYFQLLDYYYYSTDQHWAEGHLVHHFNGFMFNKLPLIRKTKVQAVASLHYLYTDAIDNYLEMGFGVEHIFKLMRIDYFSSFIDGHHEAHGIRLGFGF
ncbi:DUF5686 and carboxypeptidase regulatory-like domain-containing protein [Reichenbachiella agariperforans]|uniref:DUF5686 and carboxypeptidase regulatory-like domain-containing protein n=1 Tax=Reichenbachiella agariperforans TaxID=156994 RepID=UPI001C0989F9|nr:DUF5686 and carboxypeptidase regulatory-like domain-containing protein [Reichenbachiella agariperforans]MBU2916331.1 DUF5686 and carboxypeptidase regulatory-like domain-containing protein [Reichenbachiella agariperforans]